MSVMNKTPMNNKLVVLLADGLRADIARDYMGYLQALNEAGRAQCRTLRCELPSLSRPLYATLITGQTPLAHGIVSNAQAGQRCGSTVFDELAAAGNSSAVAAYHWFFELLSGQRFEPLLHRQAAVPEAGVKAGSWYFEDEYPDSHLLADAEHLRQSVNPDLLWVHPMGPDTAGHQSGGESTAYSLCARRLDMMLALLIPVWHAAGYDVLLTSDHGMHADRMHGGPLAVERETPLVWLPCAGHAVDVTLPDSQLGLRGFVVKHLARVSTAD